MLLSVRELENIKRKCDEKIKKIQERCKHPTDKLEKMYDSNTGGYDGPAFDTYSAWFNCRRCGKRWIADSKESPSEYSRDATVVKEFTRD